MEHEQHFLFGRSPAVTVNAHWKKLEEKKPNAVKQIHILPQLKELKELGHFILEKLASLSDCDASKINNF